MVVAQEIELRLSAGQEKETAVRGDTPELYFCAEQRQSGRLRGWQPLCR